MKIVPVKKYVSPEYPVKRMVLADPGLLKNVPGRWKDNVYVGAALSTLLIFTLTSCTGKNTSVINNADGKVKVAPIFEHGSGRGSFGCVSIAPPAFLSEEEAFQVIQEEGRRYGISFEQKELVLKNVGIPETRSYITGSEKEGLVSRSKKGELTLDGYNESKKIGFEFISEGDYRAWNNGEGMGGTVESYDFLATAKVLKEGLKDKDGNESIGIFYNPMTEFTEAFFEELNKIEKWEDKEALIQERAEKELRKQVKDFFKWLKGQGIL